MYGLDSAVFEDAERLEAWLADRGLRPYVDFEILGISPSDAALEVDPKGAVERIASFLEVFARRSGYTVAPFDPEHGTISLSRDRAQALDGRRGSGRGDYGVGD